MKRSSILIALLLAAMASAIAQQPADQQLASNAQFQSVTWPLSNPPLPTTGGSVSRVGNPGPATYYFWVVSIYLIGKSQPAGPFVLQQGPITLSGSNYASLSWNPSPGATGYDILMTTTPTPPAGACGCAVATAQSGTTYNIQSNSLNAYTVAALVPSAFAITVVNVQSALGVSAIEWLLPDGTMLGSLDTTGGLKVNTCIGCGAGGGATIPPTTNMINGDGAGNGADSGIAKTAIPTSVANDTNVTGSIAANVLTLGWTGTLAAARLNANVVQGITNDTNVTGSIAAQVLTLGWTGTLSKGRGNAATVYNDQANTYTAGSKQTVTSNATNPGIADVGVAGDPSSATKGVWWNTNVNRWRFNDTADNQSVLGSADVDDLSPYMGVSLIQMSASLLNSSQFVTQQPSTNIAIIGDSIVAGYPNTTNSDSWAFYFTQLMQSVGNAGVGWVSAEAACGGSACTSNTGSPFYPHNPPPKGCTITIVGTAANFDQEYLSGQQTPGKGEADQSINSPDGTALWVNTDANGFDLTCERVSHFNIWYPTTGVNGGSFTYSIDGGGTTTQAETAAAGWAIVTASTTVGRHTLHILNTGTSTNGTYWLGVDAQVRSVLGARVHQLGSNSDCAFNRIKNPFLAAQLGGNPTAGTPTGLGILTALVSFTANERSSGGGTCNGANGRSVTQAVTDWTTLTSTILGAVTSAPNNLPPDVLWLCENDTGSSNGAGTGSSTSRDYCAAMMDMTQKLNAAEVPYPGTAGQTVHGTSSFYRYIPNATLGVSRFQLNSDGIHPSSSARYYMGALAFSKVTRGWGPTLGIYPRNINGNYTLQTSDFSSFGKPISYFQQTGTGTFTLPAAGSVPGNGQTMSCAYVLNGANFTLTIDPNSVVVNGNGSATWKLNNGDWDLVCADGSTYKVFGGTKSPTDNPVFTTAIKTPLINTTTNCSSSGGTCSAAPAGSVSIAAAATTVTVSTTAVTANSQILVSEDSSLGTKLGVTCNTSLTRTYAVTARTAATSFVITASVAPATNPACLSYLVVN